MNRYTFILFFLLIAAATSGQGQSEFFLTVGTNLRAGGNHEQGIFPVLGFSKDFDKGIVLGGANLAGSHFMAIGSKFNLKTTVGFSRQVYWNAPVVFNHGPNPEDRLGWAHNTTTEYYNSVSGIIHTAGKKFSIGAGIGFQTLLSSVRVIRGKNVSGVIPGINNVKNSEFKRVMPVVASEISWKGDLMLYNMRYENGLLNRYRHDLPSYGKNNFGVISFEIGFKI